MLMDTDKVILLHTMMGSVATRALHATTPECAVSARVAQTIESHLYAKYHEMGDLFIQPTCDMKMATTCCQGICEHYYIKFEYLYMCERIKLGISAFRFSTTVVTAQNCAITESTAEEDSCTQ